MVKICSNIYPKENDIIYKNHFEKYSFELSCFQKYAIEAIIEGQHVLVTAHTGSGKTLPAEFAIEYFISKGKKVIYTSPIKALSNQKFYEFSRKFPNISFGILTGDIKSNPEADVLIMTAEILLNKLYQNKSINNNSINNSFEMDINNELGCVIMDEVHYINDQERGKVWEETILMLPDNIQMIMLSATLDSPERFASWCENRGSSMTSLNKVVYLTSTYERVVPLIHYSYITCNQGIFKTIKDKNVELMIMKNTNKLHIIQDDKSKFNEENYYKIKKVLDVFNNNKHFVKRQHVLNSICKYMFENNMLPALCFVLSRKVLEQCASEIQTNLFEDDSKIPYIIEYECEQIIRKLPNYNEYINLPEYIKMVSLMKKGIAIHHSGVIPVLREIVELLFAKGYIKLLFATETFAVGINMPTKTVLFCDVNKFDGYNQRFLYSHEYTQMAGRAGRRGIDNIGYVIHLTNLFKNTDITCMRTMMKGKPQTLVSKFKISYNLLLNLVDINETNYLKYIKQSMIQNELNNEINCYMKEIDELTNNIKNMNETIQHLKTPRNIIDKYIEQKDIFVSSVNKRKKNAEREISLLLDEYHNIEEDLKHINNYNEKNIELTKLKEQLNNTIEFLQDNLNNTLQIMEEYNFIEKNIDNNNYKLTLKGKIASHIREVHCLVFSELLFSSKLTNLNNYELLGLLSCFTNISVSDELKTNNPNSSNKNLNNIILYIKDEYNKYYDNEVIQNINTGFDYNMHFDLINYTIKWAEANNERECKLVLQSLVTEKDIYLGEFVKALLKINNICNDIEKVLELLGNIELLEKIKQIQILTLKYVATNQSLYV
jgi:superfamily II RNA helicase